MSYKAVRLEYKALNAGVGGKGCCAGYMVTGLHNAETKNTDANALQPTGRGVDIHKEWATEPKEDSLIEVAQQRSIILMVHSLHIRHCTGSTLDIAHFLFERSSS